MTAGRVDDRHALRMLAVRYATGVDRRDRDRFLAAFAPDAVLAVHLDGAGSPATSEMRGHDEVARVLRSITRFPQTFHLLGQSSYDITGDEAVGEVYCVAHHRLDPNAGDISVMYIRYLDRYRRAPGGEWGIVERRVVVDWEETRRAAVD